LFGFFSLIGRAINVWERAKEKQAELSNDDPDYKEQTLRRMKAQTKGLEIDNENNKKKMNQKGHNLK